MKVTVDVYKRQVYKCLDICIYTLVKSYGKFMYRLRKAAAGQVSGSLSQEKIITGESRYGDKGKRTGEGELFQTEGYRDIGEAISAGRAVGHGAGAVCVAADRSHIQHHRRADGESVRREYGVIVFR